MIKKKITIIILGNFPPRLEVSFVKWSLPNQRKRGLPEWVNNVYLDDNISKSMLFHSQFSQLYHIFLKNCQTIFFSLGTKLPFHPATSSLNYSFELSSTLLSWFHGQTSGGHTNKTLNVQTKLIKSFSETTSVKNSLLHFFEISLLFMSL